MKENVFVFDPTAKDTQSRVRGIGRYMQILREGFEGQFTFTGDLSAVIHTPSSVFINPFFNILQKPLTVKRRASRQIAVIHDLIPLKYPPHFPLGLKGGFNVFLNRLALKNYDAVITDSNASKRDILSLLGLPESKVKVVYPCLPSVFGDEPVAKGSNSPESEPYCIYVGDATWNKNLVHIARAIKLGSLPCVFVGKVFENRDSVLSGGSIKNAWQKELISFLQLAEDDRRFIFPGFVSDKDLMALYRRALVNILVSRDEGFGFSYVEAAAMECPSILADRPVFHEIAGEAAEFVDTENPEVLAGAVKKYADPSLRHEMGKKSRQRSGLFSASNFKKQILQVVS